METKVENGGPRSRSAATLFGIPIGELGCFASLLMGTATGFAAFFAATFCGIVSILVLNSTGHRGIDFSVSYRWVGLPVGLVVLVTAWSYLGTLWLRRQLRSR
jgi:uncharacterized membrane protein YphA (DoxX/SURF4 family)